MGTGGLGKVEEEASEDEPADFIHRSPNSFGWNEVEEGLSSEEESTPYFGRRARPSTRLAVGPYPWTSTAFIGIWRRRQTWSHHYGYFIPSTTKNKQSIVKQDYAS